MKDALSYRSARAGEGSECARTGSLWSRSLGVRASGCVGLRWQAVFGFQIVWNKSNFTLQALAGGIAGNAQVLAWKIVRPIHRDTLPPVCTHRDTAQSCSASAASGAWMLLRLSHSSAKRRTAVDHRQRRTGLSRRPSGVRARSPPARGARQSRWDAIQTWTQTCFQFFQQASPATVSRRVQCNPAKSYPWKGTVDS